MDKERKKKRNVTWLDTIIVYNTDCISDRLDEKKEKKWGWKSESFVGKCFVSALPFSEFCRKIWWISKPPKNHRWHSVVNFTLNFLFFLLKLLLVIQNLSYFSVFKLWKKYRRILKEYSHWFQLITSMQFLSAILSFTLLNQVLPEKITTINLFCFKNDQLWLIVIASVHDKKMHLTFYEGW